MKAVADSEKNRRRVQSIFKPWRDERIRTENEQDLVHFVSVAERKLSERCSGVSTASSQNLQWLPSSKPMCFLSRQWPVRKSARSRSLFLLELGRFLAYHNLIHSAALLASSWNIRFKGLRLTSGNRINNSWNRWGCCGCMWCVSARKQDAYRSWIVSNSVLLPVFPPPPLFELPFPDRPTKCIQILGELFFC